MRLESIFSPLSKKENGCISQSVDKWIATHQWHTQQGEWLAEDFTLCFLCFQKCRTGSCTVSEDQLQPDLTSQNGPSWELQDVLKKDKELVSSFVLHLSRSLRQRVFLTIFARSCWRSEFVWELRAVSVISGFMGLGLWHAWSGLSWNRGTVVSHPTFRAWGNYWFLVRWAMQGSGGWRLRFGLRAGEGAVAWGGHWGAVRVWICWLGGWK